MFMNLVLPWGCLDNRVVVLGTDPGRRAATSWGFQTQGSRVAGLDRVPCPLAYLLHRSFPTHSLVPPEGAGVGDAVTERNPSGRSEGGGYNCKHSMRFESMTQSQTARVQFLLHS